jgi:hypothetical protein
MEDWVEQLQNIVNTLDRLNAVVNVSSEEEEAITTLNTKWGTTPYFASLMDPDTPDCPIPRRSDPTVLPGSIVTASLSPLPISVQLTAVIVFVKNLWLTEILSFALIWKKA